MSRLNGWRPTRAILTVVVMACAVAATISWLVATAGQQPDYRTGEIVRSEIIAPRFLAVADPERTEAQRQQAEERVLRVYDYSPEINLKAVNALMSSISRLRTLYDEESSVARFSAESRAPVHKQTPEEFASEHSQEFPLGNSRAIEVLARHGFNPQLIDQLNQSLAKRTSGYIISDDQAASSQLLVRDVSGGAAYPLLFRNAIRLSDAKKDLREDLLGLSGLNAQERKELADVFESLIAPTLVPNKALTDQARSAARESVPEATDEYHAKDVIAYRGQPVDARLARVLAAANSQQSTTKFLARWCSLFVFTLLMLSAFWWVAGGRVTQTELPHHQAFLLVLLVLFIQVMMMRLGVAVADRLGTSPLFGGSGETQFLYAVPFALAPLVVSFLVSRSLALAVGLVLLPLVVLMSEGLSGGGITLGMYAAVGGVATLLGARRRYRARLIVFRSAFVLLLANSLGVVIATLMAIPHGPSAGFNVANFGASAFGALLTAGLAALALPAVEWLFDIASDVRLLELANADHKILRELAVRAPGTHQHSYIMSSVATEAAKAIGANPLLVRIGAYYHDIGKLHAPHLFVENQRGGANPHDQLTPLESARQIVRHVTYGVELARREGLPAQVIEMITGHHGTRPVHFFLQKAKQLAGADEAFDEKPFHYPGPKPQTRESVILMLADGCEAAVRSLDEPTRDQIEAITRRITDAVLADDQLAECGITMAEVARVRAAIVDALVNIHHRRVKYPGFNHEPASAAESSAVI